MGALSPPLAKALYFVDKALFIDVLIYRATLQLKWHRHRYTTSAAMAYINPLHSRSVPASSYSTLGYPQALSPPNPNPGRLLLPTEVSTTTKWRNAVGRVSGVKPITFDWRGRHPGEGVRVVELCMRGYEQLAHEMVGGSDLLFPPTMNKLTLHIHWPGYSHVEWCRSVDLNTKFGRMTRAQFGMAVANNFMRWLDKTQYESTSSPQWRVGPKGIKLENIVLLSVWNPVENSWQAEIAIEL